MFENSPTAQSAQRMTAIELRQCRVCSLEKSVSEFNSAGTVCRRCRSDAERLRRRRKRLRATSRAARQLAQAESFDQIQAVASRLAERFPPRRLAELFQQLVSTTKPASSAVGNAIVAILKIQTLAESLPVNVAIPETMEAKRHALARELSLFVLENPRTAAGLLSELGWRVEPPKEQVELTYETEHALRVVNA